MFHAIVDGTDLWSAFLDYTLNNVAEVDQSFASVDPTVFWREITALSMELFSFAWSQRFKPDKCTISQNFFTRSYLEEKGSLEIWDTMREYNQAISMSATMNANGEQGSGRTSKSRIAFVNSMRANPFDKWVKDNIVNTDAMTPEEEDRLTCVARVFNRIGADIKQNDSIAIKWLCFRLADRLGCDENLESEALFRLGVIVVGLYNGAKDYLKSVDLCE
ncbi:hypothetical protein ACFLWB_00940 [Chloroflexota bacterium]